MMILHSYTHKYCHARQFSKAVLTSIHLKCLFDLLLYIHGKQLRSCPEGHLLSHTVPGQASRRQFTSIKCPFFRQFALLESAEEGKILIKE